MKRFLIFTALACASVFAACEKEDGEGKAPLLPASLLPHIYAAGYSQNNATIWHDGQQTTLAEGPLPSSAASITMVGGKVYVAGFVNQYIDGGPLRRDRAALWVDGRLQVLPSGESEARATSVFVRGTDIYVAGVEGGHKADLTPVLWVNGIRQALAAKTPNAQANAVCVAGSDVYVAGHEYQQGIPHAVLWKNGTMAYLTDNTTESDARSLFVTPTGEVLVAGYVVSVQIRLPQPACWTNGTPELRTEMPMIFQSVYVHGADTYTAGVNGKDELPEGAVCFRNGEPQPLDATRFSEITAVCADNDGWYAVGNDEDQATIWHGGTKYRLVENGGDTEFSSATAICIAN